MKIQFSRQEKINIIETAFSWVVVLMMSFYGIAKVQQFRGALYVNKTLFELSGMDLMWAFYNYSLPFTLIIGALEVVEAVLIFFKRTRLLGCFLTTTILVNIILQDIFFDVHNGALFNAISYQVFIFIIFWLNKHTLINAYKTLTKYTKPNYQSKRRLTIVAVTFTLFIVILTIQHIFTSLISQFYK